MEIKTICKKGFLNCSLYEACNFGSDEPTNREKKVAVLLKELKLLPPRCRSKMSCLVYPLVYFYNHDFENLDPAIVNELDLNQLGQHVRAGQKARGFESCFSLNQS